MCWESEIDGKPILPDNRTAQITSLKVEIEKLRKEKEAVESKIRGAWQKMEKVCGHPRARFSSWSTAICMDCGYYAKTWYFRERGSRFIDVDGRDMEEKEREERE